MLAGKTLPSLFGGFLATWGLLICYVTVRNMVLFRNAESFRCVTGTVRSAKVIENTGADWGTHFIPEFGYEYVVDWVSYESQETCGGTGGAGKMEKSAYDAHALIPQHSALHGSYVNLLTILAAIAGPVSLGGGVVLVMDAWGAIT